MGRPDAGAEMQISPYLAKLWFFSLWGENLRGGDMACNRVDCP